MRADRLLSILLQLQLHGRLTSRTLAKRLEVSERTIHRDMLALGSAGVPVVAQRGVRGGWSLMEGYRTNLSGLTEREARALFVAGPARILADLRLEKASDAALIKLLAVLPSVVRRDAEVARQRIHIDVSGWKSSREQVPWLPLLQEAVWRERKVRLLYGGPPAHDRIIDPLGLVAKGSAWYAVGGIEGEVRTYRVSRIRRAEILEESFLRPPGFDLARHWEESAARFKERLPRFPVVIRSATSLLPWIEAMTRFGGIDSVTGETSGGSTIAMHFDSEEAAVAVLLGFGGQVEVLEPESVRRAIVGAARAIVAAEVSRGA